MSATLEDITELMSRIGRRHPDLVQDRKVTLFIDLVIKELRDVKPPLAPVDFDER